VSIYRVDLQPIASNIPEAIRLRRFLKSALRSFGLRCTAVEQIGTAQGLEGTGDTSGQSEPPTRQIERKPPPPTKGPNDKRT